MDRKLAEKIEALLKEESFQHVTLHASPHSLTVSGDKGDLRAVVHFTDRTELNQGSATVSSTPHERDIKMKASLPGLGMASLNPKTGIGGQGSASAPTKESKSSQKARASGGAS